MRRLIIRKPLLSHAAWRLGPRARWYTPQTLAEPPTDSTRQAEAMLQYVDGMNLLEDFKITLNTWHIRRIICCWMFSVTFINVINIILVIYYLGCETHMTALSKVAWRTWRGPDCSHLGVASKLYVARATPRATPVWKVIFVCRGSFSSTMPRATRHFGVKALLKDCPWTWCSEDHLSTRTRNFLWREA